MGNLALSTQCGEEKAFTDLLLGRCPLRPVTNLPPNCSQQKAIENSSNNVPDGHSVIASLGYTDTSTTYSGASTHINLLLSRDSRSAYQARFYLPHGASSTL